MKARAAFTLIELLVVIAIISILTAIALPVLASARTKSRCTLEMSAGRQLVAAYISYATENDGQLMPGYAALSAKDETGATLGNPVSYRYPWRLAPYLNYDFNVLYGRTDPARVTKDKSLSRADFNYAVSVAPAFGMNTVFVGGDSQFLNPDSPKAIAAYGDFCTRRMLQAANPAQLVVFASACFADGNHRTPGYFKVEPPSVMARRWTASWQGDKADPAAYGQVDFRYSGKTIAVMLDGHVELLDFDALNDMRRWSRQAVELDDRDYHLGKQ